MLGIDEIASSKISCPESVVLDEVSQSVLPSSRYSEENSLPDITHGIFATTGRLVKVEAFIS